MLHDITSVFLAFVLVFSRFVIEVTIEENIFSLHLNAWTHTVE